MALDLSEYFRLGKTTDDMPLQEELYLTQRTAPETKSTSLNRVIFRVPEIGLLTRDSQIVLTPVNSSGNARALNPVNGILGCVRRTTLKIDGKIVESLEYPGLADVTDVYSRHTTAQLLDYDQFLHGSGQAVRVLRKDADAGVDQKGIELMYRGLPVDEDTANTISITKYPIGATRGASRKYGMRLVDLGIRFLELNNLPMYLMKSKPVTLEVEFDDDCRNWVSGAAVAATDVSIDLDTVELVTSHIMVPKDIEQEGIMLLQDKPQMFNFVSRYMIPASLSTGVVGTKVNEVYRFNLQGRELHKFLMVFRDDSNNFVANQASVCLGDEELQVRVNGQNLYDRPLTNPSLIYYQNQLYNEGRPLQVSLLQYMANSYTDGLGKAAGYHAATRGRFHYLGVDLSNGNMVVDKSGRLVPMPYGGGVPQKSALEIDYSVTPRLTASPAQDSRTVEVLVFVSVAKRLSIGRSAVEITF